MMKQQKKTSIERSQDSLFSKLKKLKEYNIIKHSLNPEDAASDFEILEFYGDSVLYERIAFFLLKTRRFMCPDLLTKIRQECINNKNLAQCFDILNLRELANYSNDRVLVTKAKADLVEAVIGELAEAIDRGDSIIRDAEAKSVLEELLAFISYNGEKEFFALGSPAAASSSPPKNKSLSPPSKSPSPPYQKPSHHISPPPSVSLNPQLFVKAQSKTSNKQNMYKNNLFPKTPKKSNSPPKAAEVSPSLQVPQISPRQIPQISPRQISQIPILAVPPSPSSSTSPNLPQYSILSHQPPLKPMQHVIPSTSPTAFTPLPSFSPAPPSSFAPAPAPSSSPSGLLTPQALSTPPISYPPISPSSEVFLGGRNVAVYTAS